MRGSKKDRERCFLCGRALREDQRRILSLDYGRPNQFPDFSLNGWVHKQCASEAQGLIQTLLFRVAQTQGRETGDLVLEKHSSEEFELRFYKSGEEQAPDGPAVRKRLGGS